MPEATEGNKTQPVAELAAIGTNDQRAFPSSVCAAAQACGGTIVLVDLHAGVLAEAVRTAPDQAAIFCVHRDAGELRRASQLAATERPVAYFHGTAEAFRRVLPVHPEVLATAERRAVLALWQELPAGATVVVEGAAHSWEREGFLERTGGDVGHGVYRTTGRFHTAPSRVPERTFRRICEELHGAAFRGNADGLRAAGAALRRHHLEDAAPRAASGYGEWPYAAAPVALPETQPNGERWPLITVVTPSYQQGRYIEETILSVARQGYPRVEHIVMDGGSTDETTAVMARHRQHLAVAVSEKDKGQSNAINKGMARATGDILTWLNSDDMLAPGALAAVAMGFATAPADLVAGVVTLRKDGRTVGHHLTSCEPGPLPLDDMLDLDGGWNAGQFFYQPEVMFTREIWERAGGMVREDLYYSMDYDLWVRMAEAGGRLQVIGHPVAWFRMHEEQKTHVAEKFKAELTGYVEEFYARTGRDRRASKAHRNPRHSLRIAMINDHGYRYGAGLAHRRMADVLTNAGHSVYAVSLRAEPGYTGEPTSLTAAEVAASVGELAPDIVIAGNLHSAGPDPWQLGLLAERYPTLAVLHDFWLLTGRCAYPTPCEKYRSGCDASCPTAEEYPKLAPEKIAPAWRRKQQLLFGKNQLALLGNSEWACEFAREAMRASGGAEAARPVERFRLSFPLDVFRPLDKRTCRALLGLPEDRFLVMLSGDLYDARKNTRLALEALMILGLPEVTVVSLGQKRDGDEGLPEGLDIRRIGHVESVETMARYYAAADIYVGPSREETFGQVFIESIACGTPVVGVRASGMQEAVLEGVTGVLAEDFTVEALAAAIHELYRKPEWRRQMGVWGRLYVENEWSREAAYYHLFRAWRRLGLLNRLSAPEKIGFVPEPPGAPECVPLKRETGITAGASTMMGPEEGPYPEYALPKFRWAYGPASETEIHAPAAGPYSLVVRYRNVHPGQELRLLLNGEPLGEWMLPCGGIEASRLVCSRATVRAGRNVLRMEFTRWSDPEKEGRPMAAAITELRLLPEKR
jgi:glycosyltransferase involved in cell wall biosynthesis